MKKLTMLVVAVVVLIPFSATSIAGIQGATDRVPAATLLVPFFEVGISSPQDTLLVVNDIGWAPSSMIHYEIWDIDGNPTSDLWDNITLNADETWSVSMADLISNASAATQAQLTDGDFYRGFVTIDRVTTSTTVTPVNSAYPFDNDNRLEGYIYYVRLLEGSSNGLTMVPIEYVGSGVNAYVRDFYKNSDGRERIDIDARVCTERTMDGQGCVDWETIYEIDNRVFLDPAMSAGSRIIIFAWDPGRIGGPSVFCNSSGLCPTEYTYLRYNEAGDLRDDTTIPLDHAVNVIDVGGAENGWVSIRTVPSTVGTSHFQMFAFSFNSASSSNISTNWDAIFEGYIFP